MVLILNILNLKGIQFVQNQKGFMISLYSPLLAWILGSLLKKIFSRNRPSEAINGYKKMTEIPKCGSFPSSHSAAAISFFLALAYISHALLIAAGVWACLVSFSRLYLGVHYPSDILGGLFVGNLSASTVSLVFYGVPFG